MWDGFEEKLLDGARASGVELSGDQARLMRMHAETMLLHNERAGLTEITAPEAIAVKHFVDSLTCRPFIQPGSSVIDVGSGAGFPGVPLKIVDRTLRLTLVDSAMKKAAFLKSLITALGLDCQVICMRIEDFGKGEGREAFDIAVARAVAKMRVLSEYCLPLVKIGGAFIAMKGPSPQEEVALAARAIRTTGGHVELVREFNLPFDSGERSLLVLRKVFATPSGFPRKAGLPAKKPL